MLTFKPAKLNVDLVNFAAFHQYIPFPLMPELKELDVAIRLTDLRKEDIYNFYYPILVELKRSAPYVELTIDATITIHASSYELQDGFVDSILQCLSEYKKIFTNRAIVKVKEFSVCIWICIPEEVRELL